MIHGPNSGKTDANKSEYIWYIASTQRNPAGASRTFNIGVPITDAEYRSYRSNVELLEEALAKSPFAAFQGRCMEFMHATSDALEAFKAGQSTTSLTPVVRSAFEDVLSAFRRFTDRTTHLLSQRYGPDSTEVCALTQAMSREFDTEFAYRFMYHLRNYSEHRGTPIARVAQMSSLGPDGRVEHSFDVLLDSNKLLAHHDWNRHVRADLARINGEFSAVVTVDALLNACGRVHCKSLLVQENYLTSAAADIQALAGRIATDEIIGPVLLQAKPTELIARQVISPFNITPVRTDLAQVAAVALQEARTVIGE